MEDNTKVSDQNDKASGVINETVINSVNVDEVKVENDHKVNHSTYMKALTEKKRMQIELESTKNEVDDMKTAELERTGQHQVLIDKLREDKKSLTDNLQNEKQKRVYGMIKAQIVEEAAKLGCLDDEVLMQNGDFSRLVVNDNGQVDKQEILLAIAEVQKSKSFLFKKSVPGVNDVTPSSRPFASGEKRVSELTNEELEARLRSL